MAAAARPLLIVVNGRPATGKSRLAEQLGPAFGATVISKDAIKERLYDSLGSEDGDALAWSRRLGAAAFALLFDEAERVLRAGGAVIVEAPFDRELSSPTLRGVAERTGAAIAQILLVADPAVIVERYAARDRHPAHLDEHVLLTLAERLEHDREPLDIAGPTLTIDTTDFAAVDPARIAREVRAAL